MIRSFIAIELPLDTRDALGKLLEGLKRYSPDISWVKRENIHLTIKFLGNIHEERIKEIKGAIEDATKGISPFYLRPFGLGAFPNPKNPRVIWVGIDKSKPLEKIYKELQRGLEKLRFKEEDRAFSPHLTLGRIKRPAHGRHLSDAIKKYKNFSAPSFLVQDIVLFKSELHPKGAKYTALERVSLKGNKTN